MFLWNFDHEEKYAERTPMFTESAEYYDRLYNFKDYKAEAARITALIRERRPNAKTVLDVACGTHEHGKFLKDTFEIDGVDLNADFIAHARTKNPNGRYVVADMRNFDMGRRYDVAQCLFSSIGYLIDLDDVVRAFKTMAAHLGARRAADRRTLVAAGQLQAGADHVARN